MKMRPFLIWTIVVLTLIGCNEGENNGDNKIITDTINDQQNFEPDNTSADIDTSNTELFSNNVFRNVRVNRAGNHSYKVSGEARVYEATVYYDVEDGHNMLVDSFTTADNAAPEFGRFSFTVNAQKQRPNSTLMLVIYEIDAADGSRKNELPIPLPTSNPL